MHPGQLTITAETVRALVDDQFPQWRDLPVEPIASAGTVNAIFRVGFDLAARFPLRPGDPSLVRAELEQEAAAARSLVGTTRFPTPQPVALGMPGYGYPSPWSVQTWVPGLDALRCDPSWSGALALDLAEFIRGVRAIPTNGRVFAGSGRGGSLPSHDEFMATCLDASVDLLDVPPLRRLWTHMRRLPRVDPDVMTHGDLIPGNVLVSDGRLAGVLDVGGLGPADPALDLVCAWHLFEPGPRAALRSALDCSDLTWERGRAWAFEQALGLVAYYAESNPPMSALGRRTLGRILADS